MGYYSYFLLILPSVIAFLSLAKDWKAHSSHLRRGIVLAAIVGVLVLGVLNLRATNKQHAIDKAELAQRNATLDANITGLKTLLHDSQQEVKTIGDVSAKNLSNLTDRVVDLQTKVQTADLRGQLAALKADLQKTQRAVAPAPKVNLVAHAGESSPYHQEVPTKAISLSVKNDTISIPIYVSNNNKESATSGSLVFYICPSCDFASEVPGWTRLNGAPEYTRNYAFQLYPPQTNSDTFLFKIKVPPDVPSVQVAVAYRCGNCIVEGGQTIDVKLLR